MNFISNEHPTVGVEEEFHLIDPVTAELSSVASDVLARAPKSTGDRFCNELFESIVESRTRACGCIDELQAEIVYGRKVLAQITNDVGVRLAAAGSHPFSDWKKQKIVNSKHYDWVESQFHCVARRLLAMGMHIHVGVKNADEAFYIMNMMKRWAPVLIALSCNSPFFEGEDYGYMSTRMHLFHGLPRTGFLPEFDTMSEYESFFKKLKKCGDVRSLSDMWWSIRPKPEFGTVEYRFFDLPTDCWRIGAIASLVQAATVFYQNEFYKKRQQKRCCPAFLNECLWKSYRDGIDAIVLDPLSGDIVTIKEMALNLVKLTRSTAAELGSLKYFEMIETVLLNGTEAHYQKYFASTHGSDLRELELDIARRTIIGVV